MKWKSFGKLRKKQHSHFFCLGIILIFLFICSEKQAFLYFTETVMGKLFLLLCICVLTYRYKTYGILCAMILILSYYSLHSNHSIITDFWEGFQPAPDSTEEKIVSPTTHILSPKKVSSTPSTKTPPKKSVKEKETTAKEGFCMTDRESAIQRGKPSKAIIPSRNRFSEDAIIAPNDGWLTNRQYSVIE